MAYEIKLSNGNILTEVPDTQVVNTYGGLSLIGKNYPGFGTALNTDLVKLAENFSNSTPPSNPFVGQLWYDTVSNSIKFWNGTSFKSISVVTNSSTPPLNPIEGDEWFNTVTQQLQIWSGTQWILIGPPGSQDGGTEGFVVKSTTVNGSTVYYVELYANNKLLGIISTEYIPSGILGFGNIRPGLNFVTSPTLGLASGGIYNITDLTIGSNDQLDASIDSSNNLVLALNEDTNGGNVILASTNNSVPSEFSNITGSVYMNNLVVKSLSGGIAGTSGQILYNKNGTITGSPNITVSTDGYFVNISNTLVVSDIYASNNLNAAGNVNAGRLNVLGSAVIGGAFAAYSTATFGGAVTGVSTASFGGDISTTNNLNASGNVNGGRLNVSGSAVLNGTTVISGPTSILSGPTYITGDVSISNTMYSGAVSSSTISAVTISATTLGVSGTATIGTINSSGVATIATIHATTITATSLSATSGTISTLTSTAGTLSGQTISSSTLNSTPIGQSSASNGTFTNLTVNTSAVVPTVASSDNSTNVVTTAWSKLGLSVSLGASGYIKLPDWLGGFMLQWKEGTVQSVSGSTQTVTLPTSFPTSCLFAFISTHNASPGDTFMSFFQLVSFNSSSVTVWMQRNADHAYDAVSPLVLAIGH